VAALRPVTDPRDRDRAFSEARARVARALVDAARHWAATRPNVAVLYSGGLDSSLVARLLAAYSTVSLWTIGLPGARDLEDGRTGAALLELPHREVLLTAAAVREQLGRSGDDVAGQLEPVRSVRLSVQLALRNCADEVVALGQGADELFYGYARYARFGADRAAAASDEDFRRLIETEWPWTVTTARTLAKEVGSVFVDPEVARAARELPPPDPALGEPPKWHLRCIARTLGVPQALVDRPKRALQYGTGIRRAIDRIAEEPGREGPGHDVPDTPTSLD